VEYPAEQFKTSRKQLIELFTAGLNMKSFSEENTALVDQYFQDSLQESSIRRTLHQQGISFSFVAIGGYGRRELCFNSDIDILLLFRKKVPEQAKTLMQEIFFPLWDLGLDLGYGTRTIGDCLSIAKKDFEVLTSLLDARFVGGEYQLYLDLIEKLYKKVLSRKAHALRLWLVEQDKKRLDMFGDSSYLLEPDLKEGIGGLRDYHHMLWLAKASFGVRETHDQVFRARLSYQEYQDLRRHVEFLLNIRNHLHLLSHRRNDRLTFEYQAEIAQRLGLQDKKKSFAVEQFNGLVHATMAALKSLSRSFTAGLFLTKKKGQKIKHMRHIYQGITVDRKELGFDAASTILKNPSLLMTIFEYSARLGHPLSLEAQRQVRDFLYLVDDSFRRSETAVGSFVTIITKSSYTFETLGQMNDVGLLDSFIPEFGRIRNRVEFDAYHVYPVGVHSLYTVKYLKELSKKDETLLHDLFVEISHPERLLLAGLFHDIGKYKGNHAHAGAALTNTILKRFGYRKEEINDICFLVRNHLLLAETATRRDLNDERVIVQCARIVGNAERLKMLYLLTWADSKATGPNAWNDWIANLIRDLVFKIIHILEKGELATRDASRKVEYIKSEVRKHIAQAAQKDDLEASFELMSPRYLLNTTPREIIRHLGMVNRLKTLMQTKRTNEKDNGGGEVFIFETGKDKAGNCWEITMVARDRPGLFANMAGVLALNAINILSADIYTWRDGTAVDVLRTTNPLDGLFVQEKWAKVQEDLTNVLAGRLSLESTIGTKETHLHSADFKKLFRMPSVVVDNESSDFFTIIEVHAYDHVGLLYHITHTLFDLGMDIHTARIATRTDHVVDVFYVRDLDGQKIEDNEERKKIKRVLLQQLKRL
jgi:[protein-PII] uridylyltransferase